MLVAAAEQPRTATANIICDTHYTVEPRSLIVFCVFFIKKKQVLERFFESLTSFRGPSKILFIHACLWALFVSSAKLPTLSQLMRRVALASVDNMISVVEGHCWKHVARPCVHGLLLPSTTIEVTSRRVRDEGACGAPPCSAPLHV